MMQMPLKKWWSTKEENTYYFRGIKSESFCKKAVESCVKTLGVLNTLVNHTAVQHPQNSLKKNQQGKR
tara:strand:- start:5327 stop:5530 length:204 start_codon:yes stop_codon:yes gene_type:complete